VIGGGAAGFKAASRARRRDEDAEITVIEKSKHISVCRCGMPYFIEGLIHEIRNLQETAYGVVRDAEYFRKVKNIEVLVETEAKRIDTDRKLVEVERKGMVDEIPYDYLVLSTGTIPMRPEIPGIDAKGVFSLSNVEDALSIVNYWEREDPENAIIFGSGATGLECCEAFKRLGMNVTLLEVKNQILPGMLDPEISLFVQKYLSGQGVRVLTDTKAQEVIVEGGKVVGVRTEKEIIDADIVLTATGVKPNVKLAKNAGIETGYGIKVNEYLQTNNPFVYAGGDCVENISLITGKPVYTPLGSVANKHGRIIGDNVTGGKSRFRGVAGTLILKIFDFTIAKTGLTEEQAKKYGYNPVSSTVPGPDRYHHFPGRKTIVLKLIADRGGKVLGAQAVGEGVVDKRIDIVATAICMNADVEDISSLDLSYSPPYSPSMDSVIHAANMIKNKLDGLIESVSVIELKNKFERGDDFILLDVRTEGEFEKNHIEDERVINIPIEKLRKSLHLLNKEKEIVAVCQICSRGYEACRILLGNGYKNVKIADGCMALWS